MSEQINSVINNLAEKLGVASEKVFAILVKQAGVDAIVSLIWVMLAIGISIFAMLFLKYISRKDKDGKRILDEDLFVFGIVGSFLVFSISIILAVVNMKSALTAIYNPEYHALQKIFEMIQGY